MTRGAVVRRRLLGVMFFVVLGLFLFVTIGQFQGQFTRVVSVRLVTDTVGNALPQQADVKARGVIVGTVESTTTEDGEVTSTLAIEPAMAPLIPSNATARLLPKTLFGERFVSLEIPEDPGPAVTDGTTLYQDTSGHAVEISEVLDGLLPLLQAVPPQDLSNTLGALAQGFSGRGEEFGFTLDRLEQIFGSVNTELPALQDGLRGLADFSETYSDAGPQLVNALDNLRVTGNTVVEKQGTLAALYASGGASAASTAALLENNREQVISFAADSREALQVFARSSPTFGCMLGGFARTAPAARDIIAPDDPFPGVRANVQFTNPKGRYLPNQDEPRLLDDRPPACYDGYKLAGEFFPQYPGGSSYNDGSYQPPSRNPGETWFDALPAPPGVPDQVPGWGEPSPPVVPVGAGAEVQPAAYAGSAIERETLQVVYAEAGGIEPDDVPGWTTAVGAPALRGAEVSIR